MIKRKSLQIYLSICLVLNLFIYQIDIIDVYLKSLFKNHKYFIFMRLTPKMYEICYIQENLLCRLLKSLYRFKQSKKLWNKNIIAFYKSIGFKKLNGNPNILILQIKKETNIMSVYIDNFFGL